MRHYNILWCKVEHASLQDRPSITLETCYMDDLQMLSGM
jgi:hypothetical protein